MKNIILLASSLLTFTITTKAQVSFAPAVNYGVGSNATSMCSADFNGDGKPDLAVTNSSDNNLSVLLGSITGTFAAAVNYITGSGPIAVCSADFNGDGKVDLAAINYGGNNVSILLGSGTGTFATAVNYGTGTSPTSVCSADFNGDGNADLAVTRYSSKVAILLGSSTGTFATAVNYVTGTNPRSVCSVDFNGDGKMDLATANENGNNVSVLLGSGIGTFTTAVNYAAGTNPRSICSADFNGDGKIDLAAANFNGNNVSVLLGSGTGTFAASVNYGTGLNPISVCSADFDGDGNTDLATANYTGNDVSLLLGSSTGTFAAATNYVTGTYPTSVCSNDFNEDGKADLTILNNSVDLSVFLSTTTSPASSLNFDGTNDYVDCGSTLTSTLSSSNKITIEAWVKPNTNTGNGCIIGNYGTGVANLQFLLRRDGANYSFWTNDGSGLVNVFSAATVTTGVWQHVAGIWDGATMNILVNGVLSGSVARTGTALNPTAGPVWIGGNSIGENFNGSIDEARIWNRALCQGEIQNNMNGEIASSANGLLANYHFNQGFELVTNPTVTTLTDVSGNGNNGTLASFALTGTTSNWVNPGAVITGSTVTAFTNPTVSITGTTSICSGSNTTLTASGNVSTYAWVSGPSTNIYSISPSSNTSYSVVGTNSLGCISNMAVVTITVNTSPTITVNSGTICSGQSFTIVPSGASTYTYSSGSSVVNPTSNTSYSVTGASAQGCTNTAVSSVTVNALPTISVSSSNSLLCTGSSASLTATGATSYTWNTTGTSAIISVSPSVTTTYTVIGMNANGCSNIATITQSVSACSPTFSAAYNASVNSNCVPAIVNFTNVIQSTSTYTINHKWTFGNGNISTSSNPSTQTYTNAGVYSIIDTAFVVEPFTNTYLKTVTVTATSCTDPFGAPDLFLTLSNSTTTVDISPIQFNVSPPVSFNYSNTPSGILLDPSTNYSIQVQDDDAISAGIPPPADCGTVMFNSDTLLTNFSLTSGSLGLNIKLIKASGFITIDTVVTVTQFTVNSTPLVSVNSGSICAGQSFTMTPSGAITYTYSSGSPVVNPTSNITYSVSGTDVNGCSNIAVSNVTVNPLPTISVNSGSICAGQSFTMTPSGAIIYTYSSGSPVVNPTSNTTYSVSGTDINGCSNLAVSTVTVNALPTINVSSSNTLMCTGETATLTATGATSYTWNTSSTSADIYIMPSVTTNYTVNGTDANGCSNMATIIQSVNVCTGIYQNTNISSQTLIYPNPSTGYITVITPDNATSLIITDILGNEILLVKPTSTNNLINITEQANGIYFLKVIANGLQSINRIIINK